MTLIRFVRDDSNARREFRMRARTARTAIVHRHRRRRFCQLVFDGWARFSRRKQLDEGANIDRKLHHPLLKSIRLFAHSAMRQARRMPSATPSPLMFTDADAVADTNLL